MEALSTAAVLTAINLVILWVSYHLLTDDDQPEEE